MKCYLSAATVSVLGLTLMSPVFAQPQKPNIAVQQQAEASRMEAEAVALDNLSWDTTGYLKAPKFSLNFKSPSGVQPNIGNVPPAGSFLIGADAFYGQLQSGVFGSNNPGDQWSAFGSPGVAVTGIYGLRYNWEQDFATFSLTNVSSTRKDANIGFGSGTDSQLNINFVNTALVPTTVATFFPSVGLQVKSAVRQGLETSNSQVPIVSGSTGPSPLSGISTFGYIGIVTRRINDTAFSTGSNGLVLARTDVLTLQRDGTNGGLRIGYLVGSGPQNVACTGVTSSGGLVGKAFIPIVQPTPGAGVFTPNQIFTDSQAVVSVHCSFGNPYNIGSVTTVDLLRYPFDYYWAGTLTSTFNQ